MKADEAEAAVLDYMRKVELQLLLLLCSGGAGADVFIVYCRRIGPTVCSMCSRTCTESLPSRR